MTWDIIRSAPPTKLDQRTPSLEVIGSITDNPLQFLCEIGLKLSNNINCGFNNYDPKILFNKKNLQLNLP